MVGANSLANIWWGKKSLSLKFRTTDSYILGGWNYVLDCFGLDIWSIFFFWFPSGLISESTQWSPVSYSPILTVRSRSLQSSPWGKGAIQSLSFRIIPHSNLQNVLSWTGFTQVKSEHRFKQHQTANYSKVTRKLVKTVCSYLPLKLARSFSCTRK